MTSLIIGIVLIVGGTAFAAAPLLRRRSDGTHAPTAAGEEAEAPHEPAPTPPAAQEAAVDGAVAMALEELELDRAMGKLGTEDYLALRAGLERRAHEARVRLRTPAAQVDAVQDTQSADPLAATPRAAEAPADPAEDLVRALRATVVSCATCGPRPEPGARFCSTCGVSLGGCPGCGHPIAQPDARFCDRCGTPVAR